MYALTHFTVSSANDVPARDPTVWEVQGSNDGENFTTIFAHDGESFWEQRLEVVLFEAGEDFEVPTPPGIVFFGMLLLTPHPTRLGRTFKLAKLSTSADAGLTPVDPKAKLTTTWGSLKNAR